RRHGGPRAGALLDVLARDERLPLGIRRELERMRLSHLRDEELRLAASFDRALTFLEAGRPAAPRRRLDRDVDAFPARADGPSALGVCLLQLERAAEALHHLSRATDLEPEEPLHHWNLASACKQSERMGGCYLALRAYLALDDPGDDAAGRRA